MKILLANNTLSLLAGSETWTYTLALALKKLGHDVSCFSHHLGIIAHRLNKEGIPCYANLSSRGGPSLYSVVLTPTVNHEYDVIIANHHHIVAELREKFPKTPIISTIHGIIHMNDDGSWAPEHPATESGVSEFVAVSEEVQSLLKGQYGLDSTIIRNFIDVKRFSSIESAHEKPIQFLINTNYSNRDDAPIVLIRETAKLMGAKVAAIGESFTPTFEIDRAIKDSDVVFGMGRSVLEGVAAGRLGVVLGRWGYGGVIHQDIDQIRHYNFSGRNAMPDSDLPTPEELKADIERFYSPITLEWGKSYIASDHNSLLAAEAYVRMARSLTGESINMSRHSAIHPLAQPLKRAI